jgi:hypothetical protein
MRAAAARIILLLIGSESYATAKGCGSGFDRNTLLDGKAGIGITGGRYDGKLHLDAGNVGDGPLQGLDIEGNGSLPRICGRAAIDHQDSR